MALSKIRGSVHQQKRNKTYVQIILQLPIQCLSTRVFLSSQLTTTIAIKKLSGGKCHLVLFKCYLISVPKSAQKF